MAKTEIIEGDTVSDNLSDMNPAQHIALPQVATLNPGQMLSTLVQQGANPEVLEKFMALQERWEANEAKKAYILAVSKFKKNPPEVSKDMVNDQYGSRYTSKGNLINTINTALSKYGLSARFDYKQEPELITVTCILTHGQGHSETVSLSAPPDKSGAKNVIQQIKSTITYLEIVTYSGITGISSSEAGDDDGNSSAPVEVELLTKAQVSKIAKLIKDNNLDMDAFLKYIKKDSLASIGANQFDWCVEGINAVIKRRKANPEKVVK